MAEQLYGLNRVRERIEDQPDNSTRFLIIGRESIPASGRDKTSIVVFMRNEPGALHDLLEPFRTHNVDLTRVETRPSRTNKWSYVFFIDFTGHQDEKNVSAALSDIKARVSDLRVLGSYPTAVL